ncbi:HAD-IA family hydrolase [Rhodococcus sp. ARC_M12]|uniref:HAD-IA family hydrolase n=1 Tax=Rhodococcus sp. ARC_M12 TaxID=2928854 RepID=UPI001FB22B88|nr:HAD-IA family hydrolase [Rhodococcus sp. ARC_M12]MCJ0978935.1 HAD-IA family hydrolase [Rhodococcus sp. ARC_M12]
MRIQDRTIAAVLFDLDGVVTDSAELHERAWKKTLDSLLTAAGQSDRPFTHQDYLDYIDGRHRVDGLRCFAHARAIELADQDGIETWARRKNDEYLRILDGEGVRIIDATVTVLRRLRLAGVPTAIVSASRNAAHVLELAGIGGLFDARVDGVDAERLTLPGKPAPAMYLEAALRLGLPPTSLAVVEDSSAGIDAAHAGQFGLVIGLTHGQQPAGVDTADVVVGELTELHLDFDPDLSARQHRSCELCRADVSSPWALQYLGLTAWEEGVRESLCTLGNGYFAVRGALPESVSDGVHGPATYIAGLYDRATSTIDGADHEDESIVACPNGLLTTFRIEDGPWLTTDNQRLLHHHVVLELKEGVLRRESLLEDDAGRRTWLRQARIVSMASPHTAALRNRIEPVNYSAPITVRSVLDGNIRNDNVSDFRSLNNIHLTDHDTGTLTDGRSWLRARTVQSAITVVVAARMNSPAPVRAVGKQPTAIALDTTADVEAGTTLEVTTTVAVYCSRDRAISDPLESALALVAESGPFTALLDEHRSQWQRIWNRYELDASCADEHTIQALRLQLFHVIACLSPHTIELDVGVPARGLHGEAYRGHVFWDELFVLPLLNLRLPELSRSLLLYRHRRLPQARRRARELDCAGALFPWQSGSDGREETPRFLFNPRSGRWMADHSSRQFHVGLAVAYNVWHYWQVTADFGFLVSYGAEMLIEIARFWVGLASWDSAEQRFDIRGVMGPDEFHDGYPGRPGEGIDNCTYVNVMASWSIRRALDAYDIVGHDDVGLWSRLEIDPGELDQWRSVANRLRVEFLDNGLLAQFHGYGKLRELDLDEYRRRYGNIGRLDLILNAEGDSCAEYKVSKQADVLMLLYLFTAEELTELLGSMGYAFDPVTIPATIDYYLDRTTHGSTLSRVAHAWVLARSNRIDSWEMLRTSSAADLSDTQRGTTREGIHLAAMAGSIDIVQRCYTGIDVRGDTLWLHPQLPSELRSLAFDLRYRDHHIHVRCDAASTTVSIQPSARPPISIDIDGRTYLMSGGRTVVHPSNATTDSSTITVDH